MNNIKNILIVGGVLIFLALIAFVFMSDVTENDLEKTNSVIVSLKDEEINGLMQMREEEKLAHDVYTKLSEKWNIRSFGNISQSEQTHTSRVKDLIEKYNLPDPVTDESVGVFQNPDMQKLYNTLVERGGTGLDEALKVGAMIEEMDIKDLNEKISQTQNQEIIFVYENLRNGSYNHLRAFDMNLKKRNLTYIPQFISQEEYNKIISDNYRNI